MNDNLDFYDCNSSSNSLLKFDISEVDIAEEITASPNAREVINFEGQMNTMSNNNPLLTTASISIPIRSNSGTNNTGNNRNVLADLSDIVFEFEKSQSPMNNSGGSGHNNNNNNNNNTTNSGGVFRPNQIIINNDDIYQYSPGTWEYNAMLNSGNMMITGEEITDKSGPFQMDEDDIFQVDKSDLIQGPTLAELNGDNLYVDLLNIDEMITNDSNQLIQNQMSQNQFTQLTTTNFHNLQNAFMDSNSSTNTMEIPQQMFHTINVPQTPHNTPSTSFLSGGNIIFYEEAPAIYSPPNTVPTSSLTINTIRMNTNSQAGQMAAFSPGSHSSTSTSSVLLNSSLSPPPSLPQQSNFPPTAQSLPLQSPRSQKSGGLVQHNPKFTTLHELLMKKDHMSPSSPPAQLLSNNNNNSLSPSGLSSLSRRLNMSGGSVTSRLSSSAPTHSGLENIWQRREPRQHLLSTGSLAEGGSTSSLSGILSPEAPDFSQDETYSDDDSDHYEDFSSDSDNEDCKDVALRSDSNNNNNVNFKNNYSSSNKKSRYFWQYNVQAKGPKGQRLVIKTQLEDPHVLNEVTDPVFSPNCSVRGIKHSGKARKGDGNDLTPNAKKLNNIGKELDKLSRVINDMTPVSELPVNVRPKTRKEKNKLASRACRLKKKAQHEANKIKLFGLEHEHKRLINGIAEMKQIVALKCSSQKESQEEINQQVDKVVQKATFVKIADNSTEYVNRVLDRIKSGVPNGGLEDF